MADDGYKQIPSTFVVVVTVVQCAGGVFAEKPESYRVVNGKPESIPFETWRKRVSSNSSLHRWKTWVGNVGRKRGWETWVGNVGTKRGYETWVGNVGGKRG